MTAGTLGAAIDACLGDYFDRYPQYAARLGLHDYDGRVTDLSPEALDEWPARARGHMRRLAALDDTGLDADARLDRDALVMAMEHEVFACEVLGAYRRDPMDVVNLVDVSGYLKRDYAPLADRAAGLRRHLAEVPRVLQEARMSLRLPAPAPLVDTAVGLLEGVERFLAEDLVAAVEPLKEEAPGLVDEVRAARDVAAEAVADHVAFLAGLSEGGNTVAAFAIGEAAFRTQLRTQEGVTTDLDRLAEMGRADLARNTAALESVARAIEADADPRRVIADLAADHPPAKELVAVTEGMLAELRGWLEDQGLVTVPPGGRLLVAPTPPFLRWAFAMMDAPGAFEAETAEAYYYITLPNPDWPKEEQAQWLTKFARGSLRDVSIHEAYPGHYVQNLHLRRVPGRVRRVFASYATIEGWAHYSEQLVIEAGYRPEDLALRLAQLGEAILRDVRLLAAIEMHARGLGVAEAEGMFQDLAHMAPAAARAEAVRGTFDSGYGSYALGKWMLLKLRHDYKRAAKETEAGFSLRRFHDDFLALGAPPMPLVRGALLGTESGDVL